MTIVMTVYEMRTYTLHVGKMGETVKLYTELGYPALQKGGEDKKLSATSRPTPARSTSSSTCGSSPTTRTAGRTGPRCSPTATSWTASP